MEKSESIFEERREREEMEGLQTRKFRSKKKPTNLEENEIKKKMKSDIQCFF
jgi:hypothetical protein